MRYCNLFRLLIIVIDEENSIIAQSVLHLTEIIICNRNETFKTVELFSEINGETKPK